MQKIGSEWHCKKTEVKNTIKKTEQIGLSVMLSNFHRTLKKTGSTDSSCATSFLIFALNDLSVTTLGWLTGSRALMLPGPRVPSRHKSDVRIQLTPWKCLAFRDSPRSAVLIYRESLCGLRISPDFRGQLTLVHKRGTFSCFRLRISLLWKAFTWTK